jgi:hypothetical protein
MGVVGQTVHHRGHAVALALGLQVDQEAAAIHGGVGAVHPNEGRETGDVGILQDLGGQLLLAIGHGLEADRRTRLGDGLDEAGVLLGKEALGNTDIHQDGQHQGAHGHQEGQALMLQHPDQQPVIFGHQLVVIALDAALDAAFALDVFGMAAQQFGAQHRHQG